MDGNFNRICSGAAVLLVLLSLSMGCGDDTGSSGDGDGDGDGDSGAVSGDPECIGTWTGYRLSELADSTTSGVGACSSATDVETICSEGPGDAAKQAASSCYIAASGDVDATSDCVLDEARMVSPDLSEECLRCFANNVACSADMCLAECVNDSTVPACTDCRLEKGCRPAFFVCAGIFDIDMAQ